MANLSEDIQCAGSDTRPPMLDKADFASWQQRIRLYCRGKENGVNILKSIDEGPFQMGTTRVIVAEGTEGSLHLETTDTRIKPSYTTIPDDLYMDDETTADEQAYSSGEEVGRDHIPTVNLRQSWWKPLTEDRPASLEHAWTIPSFDLPVPTNNWASALKTTYAPPPENSLLTQTSDITIFMDWYCKRQGISELTPKDLEG
ncbi:hypothetical protein Tco_1256924, partial [Tanacetum coccineum]